MQYLVLSDIHANWQALQAVLKSCKGEYEQIVCCGDVVGYNPNPAEVLDWVRASCSSVIRGNHDKAVSGIETLEWFNEVAKQAALWTSQTLTGEQLAYLRDLPAGPLALDHFQMWHGSPIDEDEYVSNAEEALPRFSNFQLNLAFFGHTHLQGGFFSKYGRVGRIAQVDRNQNESVLYLEPDTLYMVNPGSVGQPRDRDPRAAYALYDPKNRVVTLRRIYYPVERTAQAIKQAHLPDVLALRLFGGF